MLNAVAIVGVVVVVVLAVEICCFLFELVFCIYFFICILCILWNYEHNVNNMANRTCAVFLLIFFFIYFRTLFSSTF